MLKVHPLSGPTSALGEAGSCTMSVPGSLHLRVGLELLQAVGGGCSISVFSKITQRSKFTVSQTKLACYWQLSTWTVNSFYLSKKLWLGSLAPFFSACFLKRNKLSTFPRPPSSHLSWALARSAVSILRKVRGPLSRDQWRSFYQHFIKAHKSLPRPRNRNMCPKYVDLQNVFISLGYFISLASCDINSTEPWPQDFLITSCEISLALAWNQDPKIIHPNVWGLLSSSDGALIW